LNPVVSIFTVRSRLFVGRVLRRVRSQQVVISESASVRVSSTAIL
jgi:hypothetical protein